MKRVTFAIFYQMLRKMNCNENVFLFFFLLINKLTNDVFLDENATHNCGCKIKSATFDELQTILQIVEKLHFILFLIFLRQCSSPQSGVMY